MIKERTTEKAPRIEKATQTAPSHFAAASHRRLDVGLRNLTFNFSQRGTTARFRTQRNFHSKIRHRKFVVDFECCPFFRKRITLAQQHRSILSRRRSKISTHRILHDGTRGLPACHHAQARMGPVLMAAGEPRRRNQVSEGENVRIVHFFPRPNCAYRQVLNLGPSTRRSKTKPRHFRHPL